MASTIQKAFRLPPDVVRELDSHENATEYVIQALREKFERDEIERFRQSARRIAAMSASEQDVEFAIEAQSEVVLAE